MTLGSRLNSAARTRSPLFVKPRPAARPGLLPRRIYYGVLPASTLQRYWFAVCSHCPLPWNFSSQSPALAARDFRATSPSPGAFHVVAPEPLHRRCARSRHSPAPNTSGARGGSPPPRRPGGSPLRVRQCFSVDRVRCAAKFEAASRRPASSSSLGQRELDQRLYSRPLEIVLVCRRPVMSRGRSNGPFRTCGPTRCAPVPPGPARNEPSRSM